MTGTGLTLFGSGMIGAEEDSGVPDAALRPSRDQVKARKVLKIAKIF